MKKVMCILGNGFEDVEAVGTIAFLRRANIEVDVFSLHGTQATGRFETTIANIKNINDANIDAYGVLFLPGGKHYIELENSEIVRSIIMDFAKKDKLLTAICAAPTIYGRLGLLKNKNYTCFTSMNEDFGGTYIDQYVVSDHHLITGRCVSGVIDFALVIIEAIASKEIADKVKQDTYYEHKKSLD